MRWLLIPLLLISYSKSQKKEAPPPVSVEVTAVLVQDMPYVIDAIGNVTAFTSVNIIPQIQGELTGLYFTNGSFVRRGDLLATIDPRPYEAALVEAEGLLMQAEADLLFNLQKVERYKMLLVDDFVSKLDYEQYISAAARSAGQVEQYRGQVEKARVDLDFCWIAAPMDSRAGTNIIDPGNIVSPSDQTPIIILNQVSPINITFTIPERFFPEIVTYNRTEGLAVNVTPLGEGGTVFHAKLSFLNNAVDTSSGTIQLKARYENEEHDLWPGQFVRIEVVLKEIPDALVIPSKAVQYDNKGPYVFVIEDDVAHPISIQLGQQQGELQIVNGGLDPDQIVVTSGQINLGPGTKVTVK